MDAVKLLEKAEKNKTKLSPQCKLITEALRTFLREDRTCKMGE